MEAITTPAAMLNEAVVDRDINMCRSIVRATRSKHGAASLILEAMCHQDRIADRTDWSWLAERLV